MVDNMMQVKSFAFLPLSRRATALRVGIVFGDEVGFSLFVLYPAWRPAGNGGTHFLVHWILAFRSDALVGTARTLLFHFQLFLIFLRGRLMTLIAWKIIIDAVLAVLLRLELYIRVVFMVLDIELIEVEDTFFVLFLLFLVVGSAYAQLAHRLLHLFAKII